MSAGRGVTQETSVCGPGSLLDVIRMADEVRFCHLVGCPGKVSETA